MIQSRLRYGEVWLGLAGTREEISRVLLNARRGLHLWRDQLMTAHVQEPPPVVKLRQLLNQAGDKLRRLA